MTNDQTTFAPFTLFEYDHDPGRHCLMLLDGHMEKVEDVFVAEGAEGNGHSWRAVAESWARTRAPETVEVLSFDGSEAGTFAADSRNLSAPRRLADHVSRAYHDRALLSTLVREVDPALLD